MTEDSASEEKQAALAKMAIRFGWIMPPIYVGAPVSSFWLLFLVFRSHGLLGALGAFLGLSICYGMGPAPMFAVAASVLCFHFKAVGLWLPIISYVLAALSLYKDLWLARFKRRNDPYNIGTISDEP